MVYYYFYKWNGVKVYMFFSEWFVLPEELAKYFKLPKRLLVTLMPYLNSPD